MKRDALQLVRRIYRANKAINKKEHLDTFLDEFELLKLEIRLCSDMKVLSFKKQACEFINGWHRQTGYRLA